MIPLENSLAGRVADIHYLLPKYKLQIYAEHFQKVEHCLLGKQDTELQDIKYVRSHVQAIGQCQEIIKKNNFKTIFVLIPLVQLRSKKKVKIILLNIKMDYIRKKCNT